MEAVIDKFARFSISIFNEDKSELLRELKNRYPPDLKIGSALGAGDCFFDSVAQRLNELKNNGLIENNEEFNVKSLRESCRQYALSECGKNDSWLAKSLRTEDERNVKVYAARICFAAGDIESSEAQVLGLKSVIWGRPEIEGKIICEKYKVKIRVIELRDQQVCGLNVTEDSIGEGNNIIHIVNYRNHFVPLLENIEKDTEQDTKVFEHRSHFNTTALLWPHGRQTFAPHREASSLYLHHYEEQMVLLANVLKNISMINDLPDKKYYKRTKIKSLHKAIKNQDVELAKSFINGGANVNACNKHGEIPLSLAIKKGDEDNGWNMELIKLLVKKGANIGASDKLGRTPLHSAVMCKNVKILKFLVSLIKGGDKLEVKDNFGNTLLLFAALHEKVKAAKFLIDEKANINACNKSESTVMHLAVQQSSLELVKLFTEEKVNINARNRDSRVPLCLTLETKDPKMAELLLDRGADVNARDHSGYTPLHLAAYEQNLVMVELFLKYRASVNAQGTYGETPLYLTVRKNNLEIAEVLLRHEAEANVEADCSLRFKRTPLCLAIDGKNLRMVELLLEYGADVNFRGMFRQTPLHYAVQAGDLRIVELLLENNAGVNTEDQHGYTPLYYIVIDDESERASSLEDKDREVQRLVLIEFLLREGANLRCKSDEISFLCIACVQEDLLVFLLLLTFSTDLTEGERETIDQSEKFSKYLSVFEKIKERDHINNFLEMFISGDEVEKFKSQEKLFIQDLSKVRPKDEDESLVFKYIYYLISCVKEEYLIHYSLTSKDKLFATDVLAGIIKECLYQRGRNIDPVMFLEKHGYGLERYKPVLRSISKTITASAEAYSELYWKEEVNESVSFLLECIDICNVNEENQEVRDPHYGFDGSHGGCSIASSQNSRPSQSTSQFGGQPSESSVRGNDRSNSSKVSREAAHKLKDKNRALHSSINEASESVNQADNQPDSRLSDVNVHGSGMSRQNY